MTLHARHFARLCRERLVTQGMTEEEAAAACEEEQTVAQAPEPDQAMPS